LSDKDEITIDILEGNISSSLYSEDLAPIEKSKRTWGTWNYAALWISMSLCIPTYMLASSLIEGGMNWWHVPDLLVILSY
jgi:cytosine/uracil/thiamine/allantoin permease